MQLDIRYGPGAPGYRLNPIAWAVRLALRTMQTEARKARLRTLVQELKGKAK